MYAKKIIKIYLNYQMKIVLKVVLHLLVLKSIGNQHMLIIDVPIKTFVLVNFYLKQAQ